MKIGILTYHRAHNYGAVLQAYALYTVLNELGNDVEMIDYWPSYRKGHYDLINVGTFFEQNISYKSRLAILIKSSFVLPEKIVKHRKFENFIKKMRKSTIMFDQGEDITGDYDVIVCGSDQIWRYNNFTEKRGFDEVYFGKYPINRSIKKISYAASMGIESISKEAEKELSLLIDNFNAVSVREDSLLEMLKKVSNKKIIHVLDPVFLLPLSHWKGMVRPVGKQKYLLFYKLLNSPEAEKIAKKIANEKNLKIIEIRGKAEPFEWLSGVKTTTGPIDFISLIYHADYVVSTSFHGVAFSIIFNKQFRALGFRNNSSRVSSILRALDIQKALVEDFSQDGIMEPINYNNANVKLTLLIENSINYLKENITS